MCVGNGVSISGFSWIFTLGMHIFLYFSLLKGNQKHLILCIWKRKVTFIRIFVYPGKMQFHVELLELSDYWFAFPCWNSSSYRITGCSDICRAKWLQNSCVLHQSKKDVTAHPWLIHDKHSTSFNAGHFSCAAFSTCTIYRSKSFLQDRASFPKQFSQL